MKTAPASNRANHRANKAANNGAKRKINHSGSSFDSFLDEQGIRHEAEAIAAKRVLAWQIARTMKQQQKTKQALARELRTSRSQLDRLLDPENTAVTLETVSRAARALGKRLVVKIVEPPTPKTKTRESRRVVR
jgi:antitoxin HicB